jgi:hypothetical protein
MAYNIENLTKLRDFLLTIPEKNFDHSDWLNQLSIDNNDVLLEDKNVCGTSACIGGWAVILGKLAPYTVTEDNKFIQFQTSPAFATLAGEWLGLGDVGYEYDVVFAPWVLDPDDIPGEVLDGMEWEEFSDFAYDYMGNDTTAKEAAAFLTKMIEEGRIDFRWWKEVKAERLGA